MQAPKYTTEISSAQQKTWNKHVHHPLQSWEWGEFRTKLGTDVVRVIDHTGAHYQLTFHKIPKTPFTIGYMPRGPLPTPSMIQTIQSIGKTKKAVFIQLEPNVTTQHKLPKNPHLRLSHHPLFTPYTFSLNLTQSEELLQTALHPKTRYNIKVAKRHNVIIQEDNSHAAFEAYLSLSNETTKRQGFYAHDTTYHKTLWSTLAPTGTARLFTATYQDKILTAWILFVFGKTLYYPYGASSRDHRDVMAPTLMLWETALWGKTHGLTAYDLWGCLGPNPDQKNPWYGFHRFKEGFKPELISYIGSYDLVLNQIMYQLYRTADVLRWQILKRKRKLQ